MTEPTLNQTEQLKAEFLQKKADYLAQRTDLDALRKEKTKAEEMKTALKEELRDLLLKTKGNVSARTISADEYAELKTGETSIKAKIDYFQALSEEQDKEIYALSERLEIDFKALEKSQRAYLVSLGYSKLHALIADNSAELNEILTVLLYGGEYKKLQPAYGEVEESNKELIFNIIKAEMMKKIDVIALDNELTFSKYHSFKQLTPIQRHAQSFKEKPLTGFERLLAEMEK